MFLERWAISGTNRNMKRPAQTLDLVTTFRNRLDTNADAIVPKVDFSSFIFSADRTLR